MNKVIVPQFWRAFSAAALKALLVGLWAFVLLPGIPAQDSQPAPVNSRPALQPPGTNTVEGARTIPSPAALVFRNGDLLLGQLGSIHPQDGVRWIRHDALPMQFRTDSLVEIQFQNASLRPKDASNSLCRVFLTNQDEFEGNLLSCDAEKVILDTWYAGKLTLPRRMVQALMPVPSGQAVLFEGPSGLEDWTMGKMSTAIADPGVWKYKNGAFYATRPASIARDLQLPDVASIQFDITWKGLVYLAIALYTDYLHPINLANKDQEPEFGGFYSLQINTFAANLLPVKKRDPLRIGGLGQVPIPALNQKNTAHIEIRASKAKRSVALLVDGDVIKQWVDGEDFAGTGKGVRFVHQGQGSLKLSNLRVTEWDGQFEEQLPPPTDSKVDLARLRNGDKLMGELQSVSNGIVTVAIPGKVLTVPINRVKQLDFASGNSVRAKEEPMAVRAHFAQGGSITFQLEDWNARQVIAHSPNFGKATFDPTAFERVRFRPEAR